LIGASESTTVTACGAPPLCWTGAQLAAPGVAGSDAAAELSDAHPASPIIITATGRQAIFIDITPTIVSPKNICLYQTWFFTGQQHGGI
jgi:hypothetical protein